MLDRGTNLDAKNDDSAQYERPEKPCAPFIELRYVAFWRMLDDFLHNLRIVDGVVHETCAPAVAVRYAVTEDGIAFHHLAHIHAIAQINGVMRGAPLDIAHCIAALHDGHRSRAAATREDKQQD